MRAKRIVSALLKKRIEAVSSDLTSSERVLAGFITANPDCLLLATSAEIAGRTGVSAMTVTRFVQKIGFDTVRQAKQTLRDESLGPRPSSFSLRYEKEQSALPFSGSFEAECATIKRAHAMRGSDDWKRAVDWIANSEAVYAAGFQMANHLAGALVGHLGYIRPNVEVVTGSKGVYAAPLTNPAKDKTLILIDLFRYAKDGPILAAFAQEKGIKVIIICDDVCGWAPSCADLVFPVAINRGLFMSSTIAIYSLLNLMLHDVAALLGARARAVHETLSEAQERFGGFLD